MGTWNRPYDQKNAALTQPRSTLVSVNWWMKPLSASADETLVRSTNEIITPSASRPRMIQRLVGTRAGVLLVSIVFLLDRPASTRGAAFFATAGRELERRQARAG